MMDTLKDLLIEQIKDLYHAEQQLANWLPRIQKEASAPRLQKVLERHINETRDQIGRLKQVFGLLGVEPEERKCRAMLGLIAEADDTLKDCRTPSVRDAAIIASMQRIQHYEMAGYGTARSYAETLDENEAAELLQTSLNEEGDTDHTLTDLAKDRVNQEAVKA